MSTKRLLVGFVTLAFAGLLAWPATAEAQRRGHGRAPVGRRIVVVGGGFGFPGYGFYDVQYPWGRYGPWGPYGRPFYPYGYYEDFAAFTRIEAEPKSAEVYVDGSQAGIVDDFDSWYQSLSLRPGEHEITLYLEGYRAEHRTLYFSPGTTQRIKVTMQKLGPGESAGPRPQPAPPPEPEQRPGQMQAQPRSPQYPPAPAPAPQLARFGTLSLKVAPADAEILVDDQPWKAPGGELRLSVKLSAGRHHIEVKKDGFATYTEDILIRPDATMTLNVGLTKK